jgi:hypothetical protein
MPKRFKVFRNIDIPLKHSNWNKNSRIAVLRRMKKGESVFITTVGGLYGEARAEGIEICSRKIGKKIMVWRLN